MSITTDTRFFDVWIVERNTVYQKVPFTVVADWLQEGRLLETDRCRPAGTTVWQKLAEHPLLLAYLPRPQPAHAEDTAEALQEIELDFPGRAKEPEDDDVDMIPLIDVSLVLLVFFMLSATTAGMAAFVRTPEVEHTLVADTPDAFRIDVSNDNGAPIYSLAVSGKPPEEDERNLRQLSALLDRLKARLEQSPGDVEVVINADKDLRAKHVRDLLLALRLKPFRDKIRVNYFGATQRD